MHSIHDLPNQAFATGTSTGLASAGLTTAAEEPLRAVEGLDPTLMADHEISEEEHLSLLFTEVCNRMENDRGWLESDQPSEAEVIIRYFGGCARRIKDLQEFTGLLHECYAAVFPATA